MSVGDIGPYLNDDGDYWVPRTVSFWNARREVRAVADIDPWCRLVYVGKSDTLLLGYSRVCQCDEVCEAGIYYDASEIEQFDGPELCAKVPAWHFRVEERQR